MLYYCEFVKKFNLIFLTFFTYQIYCDNLKYYTQLNHNELMDATLISTYNRCNHNC